MQTIPVPPDPADAPAGLVRAPAASSSTLPTPTQLKGIYEQIGAQVAKETEQQDVSYAFAGVGAVLLLTGAGLSALWFNRIP